MYFLLYVAVYEAASELYFQRDYLQVGGRLGSIMSQRYHYSVVKNDLPPHCIQLEKLRYSQSRSLETWGPVLSFKNGFTSDPEVADAEGVTMGERTLHVKLDLLDFSSYTLLSFFSFSCVHDWGGRVGMRMKMTDKDFFFFTKNVSIFWLCTVMVSSETQQK